MTTDEEGSLVFSRIYHRIGESQPACFALDLVAHEGDWRGAMRWMVGRYPEYFDPPLPRADRMAGCAAYSADERHFDTRRLHRMAFRSNWKCSEDFPYQGMFLPIDDDHTQWTRWLREPPVEGKGPLVSCGTMNAYGRWMHSQGFYVLNYFNVAEFGNYPAWPAPPRKAARDEDLWKDSNDFIYSRLRSALLMPKGHPIGEQTFVMDPADPAYEGFLLEQAQRHLSRLPDTDGLAIDRMDLIHDYNYNTRRRRRRHLVRRQAGPGALPLLAATDVEAGADDAPRRQGNHRQQSHQAIGPDAGGRRHLLRVRLFRHSLNTSALLCVRKPLMLWTDGPAALEPDPDGYFQRHLYLGGYPTAPYPGNNHCLKPGNARAEQFYLDYGPLLDAMRGQEVGAVAARGRSGRSEGAGEPLRRAGRIRHPRRFRRQGKERGGGAQRPAQAARAKRLPHRSDSPGGRAMGHAGRTLRIPAERSTGSDSQRRHNRPIALRVPFARLCDGQTGLCLDRPQGHLVRLRGRGENGHDDRRRRNPLHARRTRAGREVPGRRHARCNFPWTKRPPCGPPSSSPAIASAT